MSKKIRALRKRERVFVTKTYTHGNKKHKLSSKEIDRKRVERNKRRNLKQKLLRS